MSNFIICTLIERPYRKLTKVGLLAESIIWPTLGLRMKGCRIKFNNVAGVDFVVQLGTNTTLIGMSS